MEKIKCPDCRKELKKYKEGYPCSNCLVVWRYDKDNKLWSSMVIF
jgi:hypothetical protein